MEIEFKQRDTHCPNCQSEAIVFNKDHGFYSCSSCENVWAYSVDDPDYEEALDACEVNEFNSN